MDWKFKVIIAAVVLIVAISLGIYFKNLDQPVKKFDRSVDFFYSAKCPHCQAIKPLVNSYAKEYTLWEWTSHDVSKEQTGVSAVPLIRITTSDGREIELLGSAEISRWLKCEIEEVSSEECPTYSAGEGYNKKTNSWFIR